MVAFLIAYNQNKYLLGKDGLKPANIYMQRIYQSVFTEQEEVTWQKKFELFLKCPTFYWFFDWRYDIDNLLEFTSLIGIELYQKKIE